MSEARRDGRAARRTETPQPERTERLWRDVVGEQLRETRRARGETLQTVAKRASVSMQYLSEVERGSKEPSSEILAAIGASLELTLLDLTVGAAGRLQAPPSDRRDNVVLAA
ncbi:helix-turn-helix domain-containing protein [Amnibacterium flavum]|uniref:XRE family transcriptional regulator n=1 Tax=Amnibacterium flavum TaxID=2173173 RepID=A0A2V1HTV6_9MICO|nr:helix-turn-helix transcriptional regulator [Amnibacterium flavum]PVZ95751.1 XRE family transcriptional regulator [Amnibacterium flavum]